MRLNMGVDSTFVHVQMDDGWLDSSCGNTSCPLYDRVVRTAGLPGGGAFMTEYLRSDFKKRGLCSACGTRLEALVEALETSRDAQTQGVRPIRRHGGDEFYCTKSDCARYKKITYLWMDNPHVEETEEKLS